MILTIILIAVSLSLDALGVGLVYGLRKVRIPLHSKLIICLFSMIYSGGALLLGSNLTGLFSPLAGKIVGLVILMLMGLWIILQALLKHGDSATQGDENSPANPTLLTIVIKSLGITIQVVRNPMEFDMDRSGTIDPVESILLGLALSVDAIGVGIGSALIGFHSWLIPLAVGITQWFLLYLGTHFGEHYAANLKVNEKWLAMLPGVLLICLAIIRCY